MTKISTMSLLDSTFKHLTHKYCHILFSIIMAILVLWQLLLPGYVLLLDWVPGPMSVLEPKSVFDFMSLPLSTLLYALELVLPAWVVQKVLLFGLVFSLFYLPLKFNVVCSITQKCSKTPLEHLEDSDTWSRSLLDHSYFASMLFAINPWVYERMLAGQWKVVAGYALLMPLAYYLLRLLRRQKFIDLLKVFSVLMVLQVVSSHFFIIGIVLSGITFGLVSLEMLWRTKLLSLLQFIGRLVTISLLFTLVSLYWLVPFALSTQVQGGNLQAFNSAHQEAFMTAGAGTLGGVVGNVLMLHGFWEEHEPWIERFVLPSDGMLWGVAFALLMLLVLIGAYRLSSTGHRRELLLLSVMAGTSLIFAVGIAESIFKPLNQWMFSNISIWSGFRDSQKWAGVLAMVYALLASIGVGTLVKKLRVYKTASTLYLFALPLIATPMMLFGFAGQLQATWYPQEWAEIDKVLVESTETFSNHNCKAIFLPWQQYYFAKFNNGQLIANPAQGYFNCEVLSGQNMELGEVHIIEGLSDEEYILNSAMVRNDADPATVLRFLRELEVQYIIKTDDIAYYYHAYRFIQYGIKSGELELVKSLKTVDLYRVK